MDWMDSIQQVNWFAWISVSFMRRVTTPFYHHLPFFYSPAFHFPKEMRWLCICHGMTCHVVPCLILPLLRKYIEIRLPSTAYVLLSLSSSSRGKQKLWLCHDKAFVKEAEWRFFVWWWQLFYLWLVCWVWSLVKAFCCSRKNYIWSLYVQSVQECMYIYRYVETISFAVFLTCHDDNDDDGERNQRPFLFSLPSYNNGRQEGGRQVVTYINP